jgi:dynein heavy chain
MSVHNSIKEFVEPVPEKMLDGKTAREQTEVSQGHRAFVRLRDQEHALSTQAFLKTASTEQQIAKPMRRVPFRDPHATVKVAIPKALQKGSMGASAPQLEASSGLRPNKSALGMTGSIGKTERLATAEIKGGEKAIKNASPSERIALLYTPTANIRTTGRNEQMRSCEFHVSYRNVDPPAPARKEQADETKGVFGKDPMLSHFLPLEEFDDVEYETRDPAEWIAIGHNSGGTPARSRFYTQDAGEEWMACHVTEYDADAAAYLVEWNHNGKTKWVKRLNLIFDAEDELLWRERHNVAQQLRVEAEAQVRLELYVDGMDNALVTPVDEDQVDRILSLVAAEFPLQHLHVVERGIQEMRDMHTMGCKRAVHRYVFMSPEERGRLTALALPAPAAPEDPSLDLMLATIDTPSPNFAQARTFIEENLFQTHALLYTTLHSIHARWQQFEDHLLCDAAMKGIILPCELHIFEDVQNKVGSFVSDRLKEDWSVNIVTTIQNELDQHFNFFEENVERYKASRMARFGRMVNVVMTSQLRQLLVASITSYTEFLVRYRVVLPGDFDIDDDTVEEIEEDIAERGYWEARAEHVRERRAKEADARAAAEAKGAKKPAKKAHDSDHDNAEDDDDEPEAEQPPLEFEFWVNPSPYSRRILDMTKEANGLKPLFVVRLISNGDAVMFSPLLEEVEDKVKGVFDNFFAFTEDIRGLGDQLYPLLGLPPHPLKALGHADPVVIRAKERIHRALLENVQGPRQLQQLYQSFEYILKVEIDSLVESFRHRTPAPTQEDYDNALERLFRDMDRIRGRTLNSVKFELIHVECDGIKNSLLRKAMEVAIALMDLLATQLNDDNNRIIQQYKEIHRRIGVEPSTPEDLQRLKEYIDNVEVEMTQLETSFQQIAEGNELLLKYNYITETDDFEHYWTAFEWPKKVTQVLEDSDFKYREYRNAFTLELTENCQKLTDDITSLAARVEQLAQLSDEARAEDHYEAVKQIDSKIKKAQEDIVLYNSHEALFGKQSTQWSHIKEIKQMFDPYQTLWEVTFRFNTEYEKWMGHPLEDISPEQVETFVNDWSRKLNAVSKKLKDDAPAGVCARIRDSIEKFKPNVPLIKALRSNLQGGHFKTIGKLVGVNDLAPDGKTLVDYLKIGLLTHIDEIEDIADVAEKTHDLQKQLDNMEEAWKKVSLVIEPHRDTDSYKLKASEEIQQLLDDHIQKTQLIMGSPYLRTAVKLENSAREWEKELLHVQAVLDEWFKCQSTWSYLSPVFSSGDIAKALPTETLKFQAVDSSWRQIMTTTLNTHLVLQRCASIEDKLLATFQEHNQALDEVLKKLHVYLETKRMAFPRFYFISNDELLKILSDAKDPFRVQPYLAKCFEGIKSIHFQDSLDITAMESAEGEVVQFCKKVNPADYNNSVENWLAAVEKTMCDSILDHMKRARDDYNSRKRTDFIRHWPGQVVIAVCNHFWTMEATDAMITNGYNGLDTYHAQCKVQLDDLVVLVRDSGLKSVERLTIEALVVIEVHSKEVTKSLVEKKIDSPSAFDWLAQLRYYWEDGKMVVKQINAALVYGCEYLGNSGRLVITALTDRCYRTLMGALHLNYGGAPEGPAGTGKTETVKDLAKALAKQCVVYNCSDQITYKDMAKLFKGLSQAGAWGCFDEFNRIEVQVLSVIAQQMATIQDAIAMKRTEFLFDGSMLKLKLGSAVFITMNPGYAGRAELPDNLKALFRSVAMMVPNYAMIGEIQLYSYGFMEGKVLAEKIVATYRLCSEQLSSQDHYDYGMRAVKTVLTAAGRLKRKFPDEDEQILMLRAIQDVNLPKFLSQDVELFAGIISDLFPGVVLPPADYDAMTEALGQTCEESNLQMTAYFKVKVFETYEMIVVRHGMMIVGYSYGGKTAVLQSLAKSLTVMQKSGLEQKTRIITLNPKGISIGQLYGTMDASGEWCDGVLSNAFRTASTDTAPDRKWLVLDGPVDAVWIENMNTVLDDNKKLCLTNGDIIPMSKEMTMLFEVQDLQHASPATVSRCGMIYVEPEALGTAPLLASFENTLPELIKGNEQYIATFRNLCDWLIDPVLTFVRRFANTAIPQGNSVAIASFAKLFNTFLAEFRPDEASGHKLREFDEREVICKIEGWFLFSLTWGVGGALYAKDRIAFNTVLVETIQGGSKDKSYKLTVPLPENKRSFFDVLFQYQGEPAFVDWLDTMPDFRIPENAEYHEIIVPSADTERYNYLISNFVEHNLPCLLVGDTGTGKTIMLKSLLSNKLDKDRFLTYIIQFSAQTGANQTQELLESKADVRRRKGTYGPPINKKLVIFVDDLNMPELEEYGAQPAVELLRQWMDHTGWFNHKRDDVSFRRTEDLLFIAAMGPPGGGRNHTTPRFTRHFNTIAVPSFDDQTLKKIFNTLMDWIISKGYPAGMRSISHSIVDATIDVYQTLVEKLKPTPEKSHYTFNLRDVSKVFQGISLANAAKVQESTKMYRLWVHELQRAFADRFIEDGDNKWFTGVVGEAMNKNFKVNYATVVNSDQPLLFTDLANDMRLYEEVDDMVVARTALEEHVEAYNQTVRGGGLDLVIFNYVIEHVSRIGRVLRQPFGNALLIGVGGSGRTSCTRLACRIQEYDFYTVSVTKGFGHLEFLDACKALLLKCGRDGIPTAFFINDTQIVQESFLEDICNLLNTGEIPGLFPQDELDMINGSLKNAAKEAGREQSRESLTAFFVERCRIYLHVVLAFSPVGSVLRDRLRKFPSLVNCCTIDWFREWPEEGLRNVAGRFLADIDLQDEMRLSIGDCFVKFQESVRQLGITYLEEARQYTYVTPTSYLELLHTFKTLLGTKRKELIAGRNRYDGGLEQLTRTEEEVDRMQKELEIMKPQLKRKAKETDELITVISLESEEAEKVRAKVAVEEAIANEKASKASSIRDNCQAKVDEAQPKLDEAKEAAEKLDINALREIRVLGNPPEKVKTVIEACCCLLGGQFKPALKRDPATGKTFYPYWEHAQKTLMTNDFQNILLSFSVDNATDQQIQDVQKYIKNKMFDPKTIGATSKALVGIVKFVIASEQFYQLNKIVKPLKADQAAAEEEYAIAMAELKIKMDELAEVDRQLNEKKAKLEKTKSEKQDLEDKVADTDAKLKRAVKLIDGLGGERTRYVSESQRLAHEFGHVIGDVVLSAAAVAYLGPFQNKYRAQIIPEWVQMCKAVDIPGTFPFSLEKFLGNPLHIQEWKLQALPSDNFSVDNAIILTNARRWPLLIDPQQQANKWIRNIEKANLVVVRPSEGDMVKNVAAAVRSGATVLLENVEEDLDPVLENLLLKRVVREGNSLTVSIGGDPVEYNEKFKMYLTTKLPRPHYRPEVSTKVALINFMITEGGLRDQLLGKVVAFEKPEVETKKMAMTIEMAQVRVSLKETEDQILALLSSDGNLLENEAAIQQLDRAKVQSDKAAIRQQDIEQMEKHAEKTRGQYRPVAELGAALFFCVTELAGIDPMYQYSLQFYIQLFGQALVDSEKGEDTAERIANIKAAFQQSLYTRVCRGLFAKDQLLFSFIMCLKTFDPDPAEVRWMLMGGFDRDANLPENKCKAWLPDLNWRLLWRASTQLPAFSKLLTIVVEHEDECKTLYHSANPLALPLPGALGALTAIRKLVFIRCMRSDKYVPAVVNYVTDALGAFFVEPPLLDLEEVVEEMHAESTTPIIFVLSPGADPNAELDRVAEIKGMSGKRITKLSLGQGQDKPAVLMMEEGRKVGNWVLPQNCHLFKDFMPTLARTIENYSRDDAKHAVHRDYRLWLTSMPASTFPVSVLQNGAKLVQEPPKGLRSNLLRSYLSDPVGDPKFFQASNKPEVFRKMVFGLCFFHSLVQERRKFGPLGFNIPYEFNDTDMRISVRQLMMFINENNEVPYEAVTYLTGECNYGGRVTDDFDRRCLMALLHMFYTPQIIEDGYKFSEMSPAYFAPETGDYDSYVTYIKQLPQVQTPEIFGLHLNADITKDEREARLLMEAVLSTQPRESGGGGGSALDPKAVVLAMAKEVFDKLPELYEPEDVMAKYPITYEQSMNTVLLQELIRYNRLLAIVRNTTSQLQKAIKGEVVMSAELEQVYNAMYDGRIPKLWNKRSYPSLKPFGSYIADMLKRLAFLQQWIDVGPPPVFWISGFFFTQSFLTGVQQNFARAHKIEIDKLIWDFTVMSKADYEEAPADGCYISGLFLEGAGWDHDRRLLCESKPKELFIEFPIMYLKPINIAEENFEVTIYKCPTYKTTDRRGILSTTGHSTNFVMVFKLPRDPHHDEVHWVKRGCAMFAALEH